MLSVAGNSPTTRWMNYNTPGVLTKSLSASLLQRGIVSATDMQIG